MILHGIQKGSFTGNTVADAQSVAVTLTTGLPVFDVSGNTGGSANGDDLVTYTDLRNRK